VQVHEIRQARTGHRIEHTTTSKHCEPLADARKRQERREYRGYVAAMARKRLLPHDVPDVIVRELPPRNVGGSHAHLRHGKPTGETLSPHVGSSGERRGSADVEDAR
jgi:hypothetical protein